MSDDLLLAFDIGGTKSAVVLGDRAGRVLDRHQLATGAADSTMAELIAAARRLCGSKRPSAAGVSAGSPLSRRLGLIQSPPNMKHWVDVPVRAMIQQAFDGLAVNLENDADAAALAEWRWGLDRRIDDVIYLTCGTGQGAGLIVGGRLHRGVSNLAGEIGHVRLTPMGPVGCNKAGSVEGLTSGKALGEIGKLRLGEPHEPCSLDAMPIDQITGRHIGEAAMAGDAVAIRVVRELGTHLGHACAILIDVLNPSRISLGSLAVRLGDLLLPAVRAAAKAEAMERSYQACEIAAAALGDRVQDLAALAAACQSP
jgi:glucokinase